MTHCRSCGAPVFFVHTRKDRALPLDAEPNQAGNVVINDDYTVEVFATPRAAADAHPDHHRYLAHFTTCPQADDWRR